MTTPHSNILTLDASVLLNALNPAEAGSGHSRELLRVIEEKSLVLVQPTLFLVEIAGTLRRITGREDLAIQHTTALASMPYTTYVSLDSVVARSARSIAAKASLRGSDAVYGAVALRYGSRLVTLDREQRMRLKPLLDVTSPLDAIRNLSRK